VVLLPLRPGLELSRKTTPHQNDTRDFSPVLTPIVALKPDSARAFGRCSANAPLLIRARELGYEGLISTETAHGAKVLGRGCR
jgi:branched-chain amino acid transport system substrate-binding protein